MARITGGEALVRSLELNGVRQVFGIPGVQLDHAADALYHARDDIEFICARNEQAVSYMADGCARSTGRVGVSMVVPGPPHLAAWSSRPGRMIVYHRVHALHGQDYRGRGSGQVA